MGCARRVPTQVWGLSGGLVKVFRMNATTLVYLLASVVVVVAGVLAICAAPRLFGLESMELSARVLWLVRLNLNLRRAVGSLKEVPAKRGATARKSVKHRSCTGGEP